MDSIRVAKVEEVLYNKAGSSTTGSLHLTAHHLIYNADGESEEEMWVPYPLISLVTRLPQTLQGLTPLSFRCRTFETFTLSFVHEQKATDVFESVKELTVATSVTQLYAFFYQPNPPLPTKTGWSLYSPREEFARMGVGSRTKAWRFTDINKEFSFCPTYPARLVVPTKISDTTLAYACKYRSKSRIPTLAYLHWANYGTITRSSQPMVGLTNNRSVQDEKLIEAIFQSHHSPDSPFSDIKVYGATATNLIIDARPTTNAMANVAKGAGTENMDHYKDGRKAYLGVDNIHVMRDSLAKVVETLREADLSAATYQTFDSASQPSSSDNSFLDRQALRRSGWLRHISALLDGALLIIRNVHVHSSHVLIHCSDGWDRTAQLSSLAQLCLDPFYRTIRGFEILIEKDWLSFGHKFLDRCGHLSSEKFFLTAGANDSTGGAEAAQAFLASVQNRFTSQNHLKETSPVFHQFLECVRQIQRQFPMRFEFNQRFLEQLHYHLYACQFGTFLFNNEQQRRVGEGGPPPYQRTISAWDWFNSSEEMSKNTNETYDMSLDDPRSRAPGVDMGVLFPNPKNVRFWHELYGRTDEEMNGRIVTAQATGVEILGPIDAAEDDPIVPPSGTPSPGPPSTPANDCTTMSTPQTNNSPVLGTIPGASASAPSLPVASERPPNARADSFKPFGSVNSTYSLQVTMSDSQQSEAGPSSPLRQRKPGAAVPKLPDAFSGGGIRSMWGKLSSNLSSNAAAALSVVQDAYEGVTKDPAAARSVSGSSSDLAATGGELQVKDSTGALWAHRDEAPSSRAIPALGVNDDNPWASLKRTAQTSPRAQPFDEIPRQPSSPIISLPRDPSIAQPTPLNYSSSSAPFASLSRTQHAAPPTPSDNHCIGTPSAIPLPPSRRSSIASAVAVSPERSPPPGQQSDPLGVGWL